MAQVPFIDIARYAWDAGFRGEAHATVVALAQPESNRIPDAHNGDDPHSGSFGLLQINGVHLTPGGVLEGWSDEDLYDPAKNLVAAYKVWVSNGKTFKPWGAYVNNLHLASMDAAKVALDGLSRLLKLESQLTVCRVERDRLNVLYDVARDDGDLLRSKIAAAQAALA